MWKKSYSIIVIWVIFSLFIGYFLWNNKFNIQKNNENAMDIIVNSWYNSEETGNVANERYWKIYSNQYTLSKKDTLYLSGDWTNERIAYGDVYNICIKEDTNICIKLIQYKWNHKEYLYNTFNEGNEEDYNQWNPEVGKTIIGRKTWECTRVFESDFCYIVNNSWSLLMMINDQEWIWFHWWWFDPHEILKAIDY